MPVIAGWSVEAVKKLELGRRREANWFTFASEILETMHFVTKGGEEVGDMPGLMDLTNR